MKYDQFKDCYYFSVLDAINAKESLDALIEDLEDKIPKYINIDLNILKNCSKLIVSTEESKKVEISEETLTVLKNTVKALTEVFLDKQGKVLENRKKSNEEKENRKDEFEIDSNLMVSVYYMLSDFHSFLGLGVHPIDYRWKNPK